MGYFRGKDGVVSVASNAVAQLSDWTLNIEGTAIDVTVIGNDWKQTVQGSRGWNASVNGFIDMSDTNGQRDMINNIISDAEDGTVDSSVRFEAQENAGTADGYFYGSAVITAISVNNPGNDDVIRVSMTLTGHGQLYWTAPT